MLGVVEVAPIFFQSSVNNPGENVPLKSLMQNSIFEIMVLHYNVINILMRQYVHGPAIRCTRPHGLDKWFTTSGPRATSGLRRVVKWPAMSTRKANISDTSLTL